MSLAPERRHWPLPSYPSRRVLRMPGIPTRSIAPARSSRVSTEAKGAVRPPSSSTKRFSASRSCATASAFVPGASRSDGRASSTKSGTFSNSSVTASHWLAKAASAGPSSQRLTKKSAHTSAATLSPSGAYPMQRKPSRAASIASIRPSCPPPRMPMVAPGDSISPAAFRRPHRCAPGASFSAGG